MALSSRQKVGIGMLVSGALFLLLGVVFLTVVATPAWVGIVVLAAGVICETILGVQIVKPVV